MKSGEGNDSWDQIRRQKKVNLRTLWKNLPQEGGIEDEVCVTNGMLSLLFGKFYSHFGTITKPFF